MIKLEPIVCSKCGKIFIRKTGGVINISTDLISPVCALCGLKEIKEKFGEIIDVLKE